MKHRPERAVIRLSISFLPRNVNFQKWSGLFYALMDQAIVFFQESDKIDNRHNGGWREPLLSGCSFYEERYVKYLMIKRGSALLMAALLLFGIVGCGRQTGDIRIGNKTLPRDSENLALCLSEIEDLSPICGFQKASRVSLCNNGLTDLSALKDMKQIINLDVSENQITDVSVLESLPQLKILNIAGNQVSDLAPLAGLTALESINLSNNPIDEIGVLSGMKNLTVAELSHSQISDLTPLAGLTGLASLRLSYNQITDITPLAGLQNVTHLSLAGNEIKGEENLQALMQMKSLVSLTLGSGFTQEEMERLQKALPDCMIFGR